MISYVQVLVSEGTDIVTVSVFGMGSPFIIPCYFGLNVTSKPMPLARGKEDLDKDCKTLRPQAKLPGYISWPLA